MPGVRELPPLSEYPDFVRFIVLHAVQDLDVRSVTLFGSRARCQSREHSDWDLAFDVDAEHAALWGSFVVAMGEEAPTLQAFDLVHLVEASPELRRRIESEGIVLYTRDAS